MKAGGAGQNPPPVGPKGDPAGDGAGCSSSSSSSRRWAKGKENIPPEKKVKRQGGGGGSDDDEVESSRPRKKIRMSERERQASTASVRSENLSYTISRRTTSSSSCLPSPSPSPSTSTSQSMDDFNWDRTPTKRGGPSANALLTPPPSSPSLTMAADLGCGMHLGADMSSQSSSPERTPTPTPTTSSADLVSRTFANSYRRLKAGLRLSSSSSADTTVDAAIIGRESEKAVVSSYLSLVSTHDVGMYISGPPGTGKTALTTAVGHQLATEGWQVIEVGVMGLKISDVWTRLGDALGCGTAEDDVVAHLEREGSKTFIILDEIDSLLPPPPSLPPAATSHVLSKLFSLPLHSTSTNTVKLVAISNTLDLTVRANLVLPDGAMPQVLPFRAYGAPEMGAIVAARLDAATASSGLLDEGVKVDAKAVELLCRKVEAQNGDLRMCLGVLSSAVGLAEAEWVKKSTAASTDVSRPPVALVKVALPHVLKAFTSHTQQLRAAAGSSAACSATSATGVKIRSVPLQGKMVLVSLLIALVRSRAGLPCVATSSASSSPNTTPTKDRKAITTGSLYITYAHLLSHMSSPFPPSPESDYRDLLSNLETLGLVALTSSSGRGSGRSGTSSPTGPKVQLCVREEEVKEGLGLLAVDGAGKGKGMAEEEVTRVWAREEARVHRAKERAERVEREREHGEHDSDPFL